MVTECQLTHSHPACPLEFAYYFRPGHLLANACLPVRTTNKISKQFVAPADVRRLLSYCKGRDHGVLDALHVLEGLFRTDPEAKVGSRERQAGNGGTGESHAQVSQAFHFIHPSILPFIILAFHSFLSTSTGSLASQRHPGKFPKVPGRRRGTRGFPAAPRQRPRALQYSCLENPIDGGA